MAALLDGVSILFTQSGLLDLNLHWAVLWDIRGFCRFVSCIIELIFWLFFNFIFFKSNTHGTIGHDEANFLAKIFLFLATYHVSMPLYPFLFLW